MLRKKRKEKFVFFPSLPGDYRSLKFLLSEKYSLKRLCLNCKVNSTCKTVLWIQYAPYCNTYHILLKLEQHVKWNVTKCPKANCEHEYLMTVKVVFHSVIIPT